MSRTRLFTRSDYFTDILDFSATRGTGSASGTFTRLAEPVGKGWHYVDFAVTSTLAVPEGARLFGADGLDLVKPFHFAKPPRLQINGHLDGPAEPGGEHRKVHIEAASTGEFTLYDFPLADLSFTASLEDNDLRLEPVGISFAGGTGTGQVHLSGQDPARQLDFSYELKGANLGQAVSALENFSAGRPTNLPPAKNTFLEKAADIRLDLALSAGGRYRDPYSFKGTGHAELGGAELGQVRLLGLLSELLNFTSLRFTKLQADFQIDGRNVVFPKVELTGANSQIDAKGSYALDQKALDFNAKVYPLRESKFFFPQVFNAVLTPLSEILEVKLSGSLDNPKWVFVHGPTNFLRNLAPSRGDDPGKAGIEKPAPDQPAPVGGPPPSDPKS
ncbi:MAG: AsmA-like C-terminal region-containing protein [Pseudomonadota bacterium]